jgi:uncharacterized protein (DUF58 family)
VKQQLIVLSTVAFLILFLGLITVSGIVILVALPPVLYLLGSFLLRVEEPDLSVERHVSPPRSLPGQPVRISAKVTNNGGALAEVMISDTITAGIMVVDGSPVVMATLMQGESVTVDYTVEAARGSYTLAGLLVEVAGPLPTVSIRRVLPTEHELITLPDHRALSRIPIAARRTLVFAGTNPARTGGEGTEFFDIREGRGSQILRHLNWRATARTGRPYVTLFQQERVADVAVMLDCRAKAYPTGTQLFEAAATAAASMADTIIGAGNRVGYLAYGLMVDWLAPGFGRVQRQKILTRIARSRMGESVVFSSLSSVPERLFPQGSQVVVVSPLSRDDVAPLERMQAFGYSVLVVSPDPTAALLEPETHADAVASNHLIHMERTVLIRRLQHAGIAVVDWDTREALELAVARSLRGIQAAWRRRGR